MENLIYRFYVTFIYQERWRFFTDGLLMTLMLTFASFLGGTLFGALLCGLRMSRRNWVKKTTGVLVDFLIQLPTLVLLMVFAYVVFAKTRLSVTVIVIIGLLMKCGAYMSDIFYTAVTGVGAGQTEAARTLGMTGVQAFFNVTFPQALSTTIPLYQNQFVITLQETSLVGTLAIMDITKAANVVTSRTLDAFFGLFLISAVYLLIGFICTRLLKLLENKKHLGDGIDD